jgi:hypothetical protein
LASHNAGVVVVIVGIRSVQAKAKKIFSITEDKQLSIKDASFINAYLIDGKNIIVEKSSSSKSGLSKMDSGNKPVDGGNLLLAPNDFHELNLTPKLKNNLIRRVYGSEEYIRGKVRYCLWIDDKNLDEAKKNTNILNRINAVKNMRLQSKDSGANELAARAHQFRDMNFGRSYTIIVPSVSSENRSHLPVGLIDNKSVITNLALGLYDAPLWNLSILLSRIHLIWIATVCGQLGTGLRYSNTMGWNTFPLLNLTEKNKLDLTKCAEDIILAREAHFPATIAELYEPDLMPQNLKDAHHCNDEVLERIYIGRRFKNDTERLEKLFELYAKMTGKK